MWCLYACVQVCLACVCCALVYKCEQRLREDIRFSRAGVTSGCESGSTSVGTRTLVLQVFSTSDTSLQSLETIFILQNVSGLFLNLTYLSNQNISYASTSSPPLLHDSLKKYLKYEEI